MRLWQPEHIEAAKRILAQHTRVADALPEIARVVELRVSKDGLAHAFQRVGERSPGTFLRRSGAAVPATPPPRPTPPPRVTPRPLPPRSSPEFKLYFVLSDIHVPYEDPVCHRAVCDLMRDLRPHGLVINGDFVDLLEVSRHSAGSLKQLEGKRVYETFEAGNRVLTEYTNAAGEQCQSLHFVDGNHELRIARWLAHGDNGVWQGDESVSIEARLRLRERGFTYHEGDGAFVKLGHLIITHGSKTNKFHAAAHLEKWRHSVLVGHSHRPQVYYAPSWSEQQIAVCAGHLADPDSEAMAYATKPTGWVQGFALVALAPDGSFHLQPIEFFRGRFWYGNKFYGGAR